MSKRRGLPTESHMKHDAHFVDSLSERFGASIGRNIPIDEIETNPGQPRRSVGDLSELRMSIESKGVLEPLLVQPLADGRFSSPGLADVCSTRSRAQLRMQPPIAGVKR